MPSDIVRTFFAVEVAPPIHAALVALKAELAQTGAAVRWVRDDGLHATIKFLGAVRAAMLPAVHAAVAAAARRTPQLAARVRGLGVFPSPKRPRIFWVGLDCAELATLAGALDDALAPLGFAPERRAFRAHITLGRATGTGGREHLHDALERHRHDDFGGCTLSELIGYRSDLRRGGALYTKLWTIPFGG